MLDRIRRLIPTVAIKTLTSIDAYAEWASSYPPHAHNALMQTEEAAMRRLLPDLSGCVVLDLACGTGRYSLLAREGGAQTVIGLDNSPAMLRANPSPHTALATMETIPLASASIDVTLCGLALGHLPHLGPTLHEISRVLKPGGRALISDFHPFIFLSGGQRTFTALDGQTYAVEHYPHLYTDMHRAAQAAGLVIEDVLECFMDSDDLHNEPVIIAYRLIL